MLASLQYVVGLKSFEEARVGLLHRPIRGVSLYRKSAKPLSEESEAELKRVFEAILGRWQGKETVDETAVIEADSAVK